MKFTKVIAFVALVCVSTAVSAQDYSRMSDKELSAQYAKDIAQKMADFLHGNKVTWQNDYPITIPKEI